MNISVTSPIHHRRTTKYIQLSFLSNIWFIKIKKIPTVVYYTNPSHCAKSDPPNAKGSWGCTLFFVSPTRNVYAVWRAYLEGTVQVSQSRLNVCDNYKSQISEPAKTVRLYKEQQLKKVSQCVEVMVKLCSPLLLNRIKLFLNMIKK